MPESRAISAAVARRYLALHHRLAPPRALPAERDSVLRVMEQLGSLQFDPLGVAGRNHDLVLHARIAGYRSAWTDELLYEHRVFFEAYNKALCILPTSELPYYRLTWERARRAHDQGTFTRDAEVAERILERIRAEGPLSTAEFERGPAIDWYWGPTNQTRAVLEALWESGLIGLARRDGNRRCYDLVERLFPADLLAVEMTEEQQLSHKLLSRYQAAGLLGTGGQAELWAGVRRHDEHGKLDAAPLRARLRATMLAEGKLLPVTVEGVRGERYVTARSLPDLERAEAELATGSLPGDEAPGVAFLAPLDPLCWDRDLLRQLYGFDYVWEVYVPEPKRRWGYYVLPLLFGDRLVGRIEPRIERSTRTVTIVGLWWEAGVEPRATRGLIDALREALAAYLDFADATRLLWGDGLGRWGRLIGSPRPLRQERRTA
ncbi:MAG: DNA glycosylase AlkZ-like family protein [Candidatus Limnocylindrales bacterium]